jgi:hypothetical protein
MVNKRKINLKELYGNLQTEMYYSMGIIDIYHGPTVGDFTELNWLQLFKTYLPNRYLADRAFVVDSRGNVSDAIDIVIYDSLYSPFLLNKNGVKFVPAESVYAVFEVKQKVSKADIEYAGKKAESVRKLVRTSTSINNAGTIVPAKDPTYITAGLLATYNSWKTRDSAKKNGSRALKSLNNRKKLDFCYGLDLGCYIESGENFKLTAKKNSLIKFFYELLLRLQTNGTVAAMDIKEYLKST